MIPTSVTVRFGRSGPSVNASKPSSSAAPRLIRANSSSSPIATPAVSTNDWEATNSSGRVGSANRPSMSSAARASGDPAKAMASTNSPFGRMNPPNTKVAVSTAATAGRASTSAVLGRPSTCSIVTS